MLAAGKLGHERPAAGRDQDLVGRIGALADDDGVAVLEPGAAVEDGGAGALDEPLIDAVEPRDLLVLVGDQRLPVVAALAHGPAEAGGVLEILAEMRGVDQELLRHAADIDAGAAEIAVLGHRHARAMAGGDARGARPGRAGTDDEEVEVVFGHGSPRRRSGRDLTCPGAFGKPDRPAGGAPAQGDPGEGKNRLDQGRGDDDLGAGRPEPARPARAGGGCGAEAARGRKGWPSRGWPPGRPGAGCGRD